MPHRCRTFSGALRAALRAVTEAAEDEIPEAELNRLVVRVLQVPRERRFLVLRNVERFRRFALCRRLMDLSFALRHRRPRGGVVYAEAAVAVAEALPERGTLKLAADDFRAEAWGTLANAHKVSGDHTRASAAWKAAHAHRSSGSQDPLLEARLAFLEGSFRTQRRHYSKAVELYRRASHIYLRLGADHEAGEALMGAGRAWGDRGDSDKALSSLVEAAGLLDPGRDPDLFLSLQQDVALYSDNAGFSAYGLRLLVDVGELYAGLGADLRSLRARWTLGRIAISTGEDDLAAQVLDGVRRAFVAQSLPFDAALASLELAAILVGEGRAAEVKALVEDMLPVFNALAIPREATAALLLFCLAARAEEATADLVAEALDGLREGQKGSAAP